MNGMKQTENTNLLYSTKCKDKFILAFGENEIELELFIYGMK
jgi:hypothetical protein